MRRVLPFVLLLAASCKKEEPQDITVAKQKIWEVVKQYYAAFDKGDIDAMLALTTPDCSFKRKDEIVHGKDSVGEALKVLAAQGKSIDPQSKRKTLPGDETVNVTRDVAIVTFIANANYPSATFKGLVTMVFRRLDGDWRIAHVHESWDTK